MRYLRQARWARQGSARASTSGSRPDQQTVAARAGCLQPCSEGSGAGAKDLAGAALGCVRCARPAAPRAVALRLTWGPREETGMAWSAQAKARTSSSAMGALESRSRMACVSPLLCAPSQVAASCGAGRGGAGRAGVRGCSGERGWAGMQAGRGRAGPGPCVPPWPAAPALTIFEQRRPDAALERAGHTGVECTRALATCQRAPCRPQPHSRWPCRAPWRWPASAPAHAPPPAPRPPHPYGQQARREAASRALAEAGHGAAGPQALDQPAALGVPPRNRARESAALATTSLWGRAPGAMFAGGGRVRSGSAGKAFQQPTCTPARGTLWPAPPQSPRWAP